MSLRKRKREKDRERETFSRADRDKVIDEIEAIQRLAYYDDIAENSIIQDYFAVLGLSEDDRYMRSLQLEPRGVRAQELP